MSINETSQKIVELEKELNVFVSRKAEQEKLNQLQELQSTLDNLIDFDAKFQQKLF